MPATQSFVVVGAGLGGAKAAEALRDEGFDGRVQLFGEEAVRPYERPPLSKTYLRGESDFDGAAVHAPGYYEDKDIELRTSSTVVSLDPSGAEIELDSGERIGYDRLLITTGAAPRRIAVPGAELDGVRYLRTVADSDALRAAFTSAVPVVVIGAGWIGTEVAASARQLGAAVTMVDLGAVPLERVLGTEVGRFFSDLHDAHGVHMHFGTGIESIRGKGRAEEVRLADGTSLPAGLVVVGVGVLPRTELAETAGLEVENGIVTDELFATSAPDIYAAGDVASVHYPSYGKRIRLEHWSAALNQGPAAARSMLGRGEAYDRVPYFFSDQYDFGMEYRGLGAATDDVVFRGDPATGAFIAFWTHKGRVTAAMNANLWDDGDTLEALVRSKVPVDVARLSDPGTELSELVGAR